MNLNLNLNLSGMMGGMSMNGTGGAARPYVPAPPKPEATFTWEHYGEGPHMKSFRRCTLPGCTTDTGYQADKASNMTRHQQMVHDVGVKWHKCEGYDGCTFKGKAKDIVKQHRRNVHGVGAEKWECDVCGFKLANKDTLRQHKNNIHEQDILWRYCQAEGCGERFKHAGLLSKHEISVHGKESRQSIKQNIRSRNGNGNGNGNRNR
jgi:hypothetical protein